MDREALETLVRIHQAQIYRYVRYLGGDSASAEDLVQETFLVAFRHASPPDAAKHGAMAAWLRGVARNLFLRHCRSSRTSPVKADSESVERAEAAWTSEFLRGGDGFDYLEALRKCIDALSDKQREVLELRYAQKEPRAAMARICEMTENGVKSLLRRIRATLAGCIKARLGSETA